MNYEELVKNRSGEILEKLISWAISQNPVEIRFDFQDADQWAIITMYVYEEDQEISLRLHMNEQYDLFFGYYDEEDEFFEVIHQLTEEEKKIIPEALKKIMKKVLADEEGMRLSGNFLSN
ncbi:MAG: hypothetical protein RLZZ28_1841 [Bacteroidota bacterium]|jgi:hypothetical protein